MNKQKSYPLSSLYFYLSSYCNCACAHCWIAPEFLDASVAPAETSLESLEKAIDDACTVGLTSIKLTGGEPLLSPHVFPLMRYAARKGIAIVLETNGVLINEDSAQIIKECGVSLVSVSLDGPTADIHEALRGVSGVFEATVAGIRHLVRAGVTTQVIMSLYTPNLAFVADTVRFAEELGARSVKINCISSIERGRSVRDNDHTLTISEHINLYAHIKKDIEPAVSIPVLYDIPPAFRFFPTAEFQAGSCGIKSILGVLADGSISICGIGRAVPELVMGNINTDRIAELWRTHECVTTLRDGLPHDLTGVCGRCMLKGMCVGKCRAEAYYNTKNLFSSFAFCQQAYDEGLFPKSLLSPKTQQEVS